MDSVQQRHYLKDYVISRVVLIIEKAGHESWLLSENYFAICMTAIIDFLSIPIDLVCIRECLMRHT